MASEAVEIERKFLVERLPDLSAASKAIICQGYLTDAADSVEMRLRQKNDVYYLTLKADGGITRLEREAEITKVQFDTFWPQTVGRRVEKVRWTGALSDGLSYELDLFDGELAGLQMVEVEFPSENAAHDFVPPDWFGADVTHDKRYKNKSLALNGLPTGD